MTAFTVSVGTTTNCRSCRARIIWAQTASGKMMPLDADPVTDGEWSLENGVARPVKDELPGLSQGQRYRAHWASCTDADQWRR